jgi:hypothetical protein
MNRLYVLKNVAYGAKQGGVVADINEIDQLLPGAVAFFNEKGVLLTVANAAANIGDTKTFIAAVGRADDGSGVDNLQVVSLNRRGINDINRVNYRAYVRPVQTVSALPFAAGDTGELYVKVQNVSFTSRNLTAQKAASYTKSATDSIEDAVDGIVAALNLDNRLFTAAKVGTNTFTITPKQDDISLDITLGGILDGSTIATTTAPVYGVGVGRDVRVMEGDFSIEGGNGNYIDYTPEWYSRELEATIAGTYDMITLTWTGQHSSPTGRRPVMHNRLIITPLSTATAGAANQNTANILGILALIIPNAYSGTTNAETGTDDGTDHDGVAGN